MKYDIAIVGSGLGWARFVAMCLPKTGLKCRYTREKFNNREGSYKRLSATV
jgi:hypothetical protein